MPTRILIVEDSPTQAEALRELLEGAGYAVGVATSGQEGLERFEAAPPDIVVSDIVMPGGVDGYELCRRIKMGEHNGTPVVLLTSLSDPMDIIHGLECGADNFLTKPYDPGHLLDRLQLLLATRRARKRDRVRAGVKLIFMGREFTISSEREQILDLLVTTFEEAVRQNHDLRQREEELTAAQTQLARYARSLEAQLESILSSVPDVLFSVTADGAEVRYVSPAVSHVFGCTPEAFTLEYWREHVHADDRDKAWSAFLHAVESKTAQAVEYRYSIRPGETNWILEHFVPAANGVPRVDGIARDVTERKEAERALRESEEALRAHRAFLRQVIDADPNLLFVKDWDGRFTLVNKAVAAIYGTTPEQLTGKTDADFNPNREEVEHFLQADREVMTSLLPKLIAEEVVTNPETGATRWFYTVKVPLVGPDGTARQVLGVATDITERKSLEAQFLQAQKMEAVGQLAGGIAHDFNNLLTAITGYAELLRQDLPPGGTPTEDVDEILAAVQRASTLTRQLLAFSRRQVLQPVVLDPNALVAGLEKMLGRLIGEDIEVVTRLDPHLGRVKADPGQLEQVLLNLAVNARDAMPSGGTLTIETANAELDEPSARTHGLAGAGRYVVITVNDTGTGMDAATRAHIFEPFFTTKESGKGTGLGLATVYGIVKQSRGHVTVYSEPGLGSTFRVYLPRVTDAAEVVAPSDPHQPVRGGSETILLTEDDAAVRGVAAEILERLGYTVLTASSGQDALATLAGHQGPIHLVVTDVVMPGMGGRELVALLNQARPGLKAIFTSGYAGDALSRRGVVEPGIAFLEKPFTAASLARKVREVLDATGPA